MSSIQRNKRAVVIIRVIGFAGLLLDDEPFRIARAAGNSSIDVVFSIAATWQPVFPIPEGLPADVAWQRFTLPLLKSLQKFISLLRRPVLDPCARRADLPFREARRSSFELHRRQFGGMCTTFRRTGKQDTGRDDKARRKCGQPVRRTTQ